MRSILVTDSSGKVAYDSAGFGVGVDVSDRAYFRVHADAKPLPGGHDHYIGPPVQSRTLSDWFVPFSRSLHFADGRFAGVLVLTVSVEYLADVLSDSVDDPGSFVALVGEDGDLFARYPSNTQMLSRPLPLPPAFVQALKARKDGVLRAPSVVDGTERLLAYGPVPGAPMATIVGESMDEILGSWRALARWLWGGSGLIAAILAGTFAAFLAYIRARERSEAATLVSEANLHALADNANVGISVFQDGHRAFVNRQAAGMLGYGIEEFLPLPLDKVIHPDSLGRVLEHSRRRAAGEDAPARYEFAALAKDGRAVPLEGNYARTTWNGRPAVMAFTTDITDRKTAERSLSRSNRLLTMLGRANQAVVASARTDAMLASIARNIVETGGYLLCWVGEVHDGPNPTVQPVACFARRPGSANDIHDRRPDPAFGTGPSSTALRERKPVIAREGDGRLDQWRPATDVPEARSAIFLPVKAGEEVNALIVILASEPQAFLDDEVNVLALLAAETGYALHVSDSVQRFDSVQGSLLAAHGRLEEALLSAITAIARTIEARDPYTAGHQERVARLAEAMGREMGLPEAQIRGIGLAARMHDIGKIGVPAEILAKPTRLTGPEKAIVNEHPQIGFDIVKEVAFPWPIGRVILEHHERIDGSGYPKGLKEADICLEAQIVGAADVAEAVMSHRPYRPALGLETAVAELERQRGQAFSARVADACIKVVTSGLLDVKP